MKSYVCVFTKGADKYNCNLQLQELKTTLEGCFINKINEDFSLKRIDECVKSSHDMGFNKFVLLSDENVEKLTDALRQEYGNSFDDIYCIKENFERDKIIEEDEDIYPIKEEVEKELAILAKLNEEGENGDSRDPVDGGPSGNPPQPQGTQTTISQFVEKIIGYYKENRFKVAGSVFPFSFLVPKDITAYASNPTGYNEFKEYVCPDIQDLRAYFNTKVNGNIQISYEDKKDNYIEQIEGKDTFKPTPTLWKSLQSIEYFKGNRYFRNDGNSVHPVYNKIKSIFKAVCAGESDNYTTVNIRSIIFNTLTQTKISKFVDAIMEKFVKVNKDAVTIGRQQFSKKGNLGDGVYCFEDMIVAFNSTVMEMTSSRNFKSETYIQILTSALTARRESVISKFIRYREADATQTAQKFDIKSFNAALQEVNKALATGSVCKALVPVKAPTNLPPVDPGKDKNKNGEETSTNPQTGNLIVKYNVVVLPTGAINEDDANKLKTFSQLPSRYVVFDDVYQGSIAPLISRDVVKNCLSEENYKNVQELYDSVLIDPDTRAPLTVSSFLYDFPRRVYNDICGKSVENFHKIQIINLNVSGLLTSTYRGKLDDAKVFIEGDGTETKKGIFLKIIESIKGSEKDFNKNQAKNDFNNMNFSVYNPLEKIQESNLTVKTFQEDKSLLAPDGEANKVIEEITKNELKFDSSILSKANSLVNIITEEQQKHQNNLDKVTQLIIESKKCFYSKIEPELQKIIADEPPGYSEISKNPLLKLQSSDEYKDIINRVLSIYGTSSENAKYLGIQQTLINSSKATCEKFQNNLNTGNGQGAFNTFKNVADLIFGDIARNMVINPFKDWINFWQNELKGTLTGALISTVSKLASLGFNAAKNSRMGRKDNGDKRSDKQKDEDLLNSLTSKLKDFRKEGYKLPEPNSEEAKNLGSTIKPEQLNEIAKSVINSYKGLIVDTDSYNTILKLILKNLGKSDNYNSADFAKVVEAIKQKCGEIPLLTGPTDGNGSEDGQPPAGDQGQGGSNG